MSQMLGKVMQMFSSFYSVLDFQIRHTILAQLLDVILLCYIPSMVYIL